MWSMVYDIRSFFDMVYDTYEWLNIPLYRQGFDMYVIPTRSNSPHDGIQYLRVRNQTIIPCVIERCDITVRDYAVLIVHVR